MKSSLKRNFSASASGWKSPHARMPKMSARLGPRRSWMYAAPFRSTQVITTTRPKQNAKKTAIRATVTAMSNRGRSFADLLPEHADRFVAHPREGRLGFGDRLEDRRLASEGPPAPSRFPSVTRISIGFFAFPRAGNPNRNRCTRPAWFVKVPPRSATEADGRTAVATFETGPSFVPTWTTNGTLASSAAVSSSERAPITLPKTRRASIPPPAIFGTSASNAAPPGIPSSSAPGCFGSCPPGSGSRPRSRPRDPAGEGEILRAEQLRREASEEVQLLVGRLRGGDHADPVRPPPPPPPSGGTPHREGATPTRRPSARPLPAPRA